MDRFVIRSTASWKAVDCSFSRSFASKSFTGKKSTPKAKSDRGSSCSLSLRDKTLLKIFSSQPDEPLNDENINPMKLLEKNSILPAQVPYEETSSVVEELGSSSCQTTTISGEISLEQQISTNSGSMSRTGTPTKKNATSSAEGAFPGDHQIYARLQRDLNSPSANARIRAMKALRSPTKSGYTNFDVPYEEQDIITEEERHIPKSIEEVMRNVVIYVEVRTGEDNRSAGVKKVISQLGAKVNDRFLRDTTHVVFKDGLQSTYNKAKKWNIPIVSILWIEACKKHMILMSPKLYPISNIARYENPELFTKMKRQKSMQPNAEEKVRRNKVKMTTSKETEIDKTVKISSAIRIPRKPKDKLVQIFSEFQEKLMNTPEDSEDIMKLDSKLLQRIKNSSLTPKVNSETVLDKKMSENSDDDFEESKTPDINAKKALIFEEISSSTVKSAKRRRSSANLSSITMELNATSTSHSQRSRTPRRSSMSSFVENKNKIVSGTNNVSETVIMEEPCEMDEIQENNNEKSTETISNFKRRATTFSDIQLDITKDSIIASVAATTPENQAGLTILHTPQSMNQTGKEIGKSISVNRGRRRTCFNFESDKIESIITKTPLQSGKEGDTNCPITVTDNYQPSLRKSSRRKTVFNSSCAVEEESNDSLNSRKNSNTPTTIRPKLFNLEVDETPKTQTATILDDINSSLTFSSTKTPSSHRRRTLFDISMDIIDQRVQNINKSAKQIQSSVSNAAVNASIVSPETSMASITLNEQGQEEKHSTIDAFSVKSNNDNSKQSIVQNDETATMPKKRKLFDPTKLLLMTSLLDNDGKDKKRIRKDDDLKSILEKKIERKTKSEIKEIKKISRRPVTGKNQNRRSTLDFEQVRQFKSEKETFRAKQDDTKLNYLVYTNMHTEQINFIKEAVKKLQRFKLEDTVTDRTTHIVSLEPRRTLNLLRGIIRGIWILDYKWILESVERGKWLYEEPYELQNFSRAVEICRSERQAFGSNYKIDLFIDIPPIYVSKNSNIPAKNIEELILLCSGHIVKDKNNAKYLIGESSKDNPTNICLNPIWVLDSIADNQIKKIHKYIITD